MEALEQVIILQQQRFTKEPLPETIDGIDFLIVMGGPQSPDEDENFHIMIKNDFLYEKERLLRISIVSVCLGAQLPICCLWCEV